MKLKRSIKVIISLICTLALMVTNLSPLSWGNDVAGEVQAAGESTGVDLTKLREITWTDFNNGSIDLGYDADLGNNIATLKNSASMNNTIFNGNLILNGAGSDFRYGAKWSALVFVAGEDGKLTVNSSHYTFSNTSIATTYDPAQFGLESFNGKTFNLKIAIMDMNKECTSATVGIWINNIMLGGKYFTLTKTSEDGDALNNTIVKNGGTVWMQSASSAYPVETLEQTVDLTKLTEITWTDFNNGSADLGYDADLGNNVATLKNSASMNNTIFNGNLILNGAGSDFRYGAKWSALNFVAGDDGKLTVGAAYYTFSNTSIATTYDPAQFGLESFNGKTFNLKIAIMDMNEACTSATVGIWINNIMLGGNYFTLTRNNDQGDTLNNTVVKNGGTVWMQSASLDYPIPDPEYPTPAQEPAKEITWSDFDGAEYGKTYTAFEKVTYTGTSMNNTFFEDEIIFSPGSQIRYGTNGGWAGIQIGVTAEGKLQIGSDVFTDSENNNAFKATYEPTTFGLDTFANERLKLSIEMRNVTKTSATAKIWVNNIQVGEEFSMTSNDSETYQLGCDVGMVTADSYSVTIPQKIVDIPTDLTEISWEEFGITGGTEFSQYAAKTATHLENLNNTLFNGDVLMGAGNEFRYGCDATVWSGLHVVVNGDGTLTLNSGEFTLSRKLANIQAANYGLTSFADNKFNLKIAMTDVTSTTATVGVWVNDQIVGGMFTMTSTKPKEYVLGNTIHMYTYTGTTTITPYSIRTSEVSGLTKIRLSDWNSDVNNDGLLRGEELSGQGNSKVDTLLGTSLTETIKFMGPTDSDSGTYYFCYGGTTGTDKAWGGIRIALVGDEMWIYGAGTSAAGVAQHGISTIKLTAEKAGIASFIDTEITWRIDTVKLGNHVLLYMFFNGKLYNGAPFVLVDFADSITNTLIFYPYPVDSSTNKQEERPAALGSTDKTLDDLYHDLDKGVYTVPSGMITVQKKENGKWVAMTVNAGETINAVGDYHVEYNDGVSKYEQEVILYKTGHVKADDNDKITSVDLVKALKIVTGDTESALKCEVRAADMDKDYKLDSEKDTKKNSEIEAIRNVLLGISEVKAENKANIMPVVGFYGPVGDTLNDKIFKLAAEAGINRITQYQNQFTDSPLERYYVYQQLTLAQKYGMDITVQDHHLTANPSTVTQADVQEAVTTYKDYQSFGGLYITDEPYSEHWGNTSENTDRTVNNYAPLAQAVTGEGIFAASNVGPYWYKVVNKKTAQYKYTSHLRDYVDKFNPQILSFDYYPFQTSQITAGNVGDGVENASQYFENLAMVRFVANEKSIPFWAFVQTGDGYESTERKDNNPTEGELKWQVNTSLAFGAKGIEYFTLVQPESFATVSGSSVSCGLIGSNGEKTQWYDYVATANKQIAAIDEVLMNAVSDGLMATGGYAKSQATDTVASIKLYKNTYSVSATETLTTPVHTSYNGATVSSADSTYGALTGCFQYGEKHALYIVNYNVTKENNITVSFGSEVTAATVYNADMQTQTGSSINMTLGAGEAVLVVY